MEKGPSDFLELLSLQADSLLGTSWALTQCTDPQHVKEGPLKRARDHPQGHGCSNHTMSSFFGVCSYTCVCLNVEARGQTCVSFLRCGPSCFCFCFFGLGSLIKLGWLASKLQGPAYFWLPTAAVTSPCMPQAWLTFIWLPGIRFSACLASPLAIKAAPSPFCFHIQLKWGHQTVGYLTNISYIAVFVPGAQIGAGETCGCSGFYRPSAVFIEMFFCVWIKLRFQVFIVSVVK